MGNRNQTTSLQIPPAVNVSITYYWNDLGNKPDIDYSKVFSEVQSKTGIHPLRLCVEKKEGFCWRNCQETDEIIKPVVIVTIKAESGSVWEDRFAAPIKDTVNDLWSSMYKVDSCCIEILCDVD